MNFEKNCDEMGTPDYDKMKKTASEFASFLIKSEIDFKSSIAECDDGLAVYIDFKSRGEKNITFFFKDNGYVGVESE